MQELIERINDLGCVCVPAHPYRQMGVASLLDGIFDLEGIAGVETHNGSNSETDNTLALAAASHLKLPTLGGSDCHKAEAVGRCATEFLQPVADMAGLVAAIRAGACRGAYRPGLRFGNEPL